MGPEKFEIERCEEVGRVRLVVRGELDLSTVDVLRSELDELAHSHSRVVMDLSELRFIDCAGLALLVSRRKEANGSGQFSLRAHCSRPVRRAMEVTQLEDVLLETADER